MPHSTPTDTSATDTVDCSICLTTVPKDDSVKLKLCGCSFCRDCLCQMVKINVEGHTVQRLKCPASHGTAILRQEVKTLVDADTYLKYIRLLHENSVLMDPSRSFCPQSGCGAVCYSSVRPGARAVRCVECGFKFCCLCHERWPGSNHICPEDLPLMTQPDRARSNGSVPLQFFVDDAAGDPVGVGQDTPSSSSATATQDDDPTQQKSCAVKRCPRCGVPIERREGCAHMKCARCGHSFCWFCMADLNHDYFLHHFESGPCREALGHPRAMVHLYRLQAMCAICGLGTLALLCAPFAIFCAPCIVLCAPHMPQCFFPAEQPEVRADSASPFNVDEFGDDTDSEPDVDQRGVGV